MGALVLAPGESVTEHLHPYSEEFLYVTSGTIHLRAGEDCVRLDAGDALMVPIGVPHRAENQGSSTAQAVFHLSPLAPSPELGHVDTEELADPQAPDPFAGGAR